MAENKSQILKMYANASENIRLVWRRGCFIRSPRKGTWFVQHIYSVGIAMNWMGRQQTRIEFWWWNTCCTARLKRDGTRAETIFGLSAKRTSPFKSAGGSVQSTAGSWGVRISSSNGSNAGYTMFRGRVQDYWLPTALACFPFTSPPARHRVPSHFNWILRLGRYLRLMQTVSLM